MNNMKYVIGNTTTSYLNKLKLKDFFAWNELKNVNFVHDHVNGNMVHEAHVRFSMCVCPFDNFKILEFFLH